jgi:hypothetical protein
VGDGGLQHVRAGHPHFRITEKGRATYTHNKTTWEYAKRVLDTLL